MQCQLLIVEDADEETEIDRSSEISSIISQYEGVQIILRSFIQVCRAEWFE